MCKKVKDTITMALISVIFCVCWCVYVEVFGVHDTDKYLCNWFLNFKSKHYIIRKKQLYFYNVGKKETDSFHPSRFFFT